MTDNANNPEPLDLLIASIPHKSLLAAVKANDGLARVVFQGFSARLGTLGLPLVRQRLERELTNDPALAEEFFALWQQLFPDLPAVLNAPEFTPSAATLRPLLESYGPLPLRYALLHADREDVRAWADRLNALDAAPPPAPEPIPPAENGKQTEQIAALRKQLHDAKAQVREITRERDELTREVARLEKQLANAAREEEALRRRQLTGEDHLQREERRTRKAQEEAEELKKRLQRLERLQAAPSAPPPPPVEPARPVADLSAVAEAVRLLQSVLESTPAAPTPTPVEEAPAPPQPRVAPKAAAPQPSVTLTIGRKKQEVPIAKIMSALVRNDEKTVKSVRDAIAHLAPAREQEMLATLAKFGIPGPVLSGPLRPAIIDGSNVANMSPERRARLAYLEQIRRSAWAEGYFPVLIIVDASLRHQIDRPDDLMTLIERGEIRMASAGTAADELIIEEAAARNAVIVTNDRYVDWPAAKSLDKRHAKLHNGVALLGNFHDSSLWFH